MKKEELFFMMDESVSDNKESIVDYMLSWTLRMSSVSDDGYNNLVQKYCSKILSKIVFDDIHTIDQNYQCIQSVETWRQWNRIDLCAEIAFIDNENNISKHALLMENKAYSCLHHDQLNKYKKTFEDHYKGTAFENNLHYVYFSIQDDLIATDKVLCVEANFQAYTMDEIRDCIMPLSEFKATGNEIFDEFWIRNWG